MNILSCINNQYLYPLIGLFYSIRKHTKEEINLYLLTTDFSDKSEKKLKKTLNKININVSVIRVELNSGFNVGNHHYSLDMYLRIFAFHYLPKDINKVLYLDADMLATDDISKIYETNLEQKLIAAVPDINYEKDYVQSHANELNIDHIYFNSGMILFNLKNIRSRWDLNFIESFILENNNRLMYPDQDVLNLLCKESDIYFLEFNCNLQKFKKDFISEEENPVILHYVGNLKPWNHFFNKSHEKLFWKNFKSTKCCKFYILSFKYKVKNLIKSIKRRVAKVLKKKK